MSDEKDGGPAFSVGRVSMSPATYDATIVEYGLSVRDWFAGMAISGVMTDNIDFDSASWPDCARHAYALADAMLEARKAQP